MFQPNAIRLRSQTQLSGEKPNPCPSHPLAGSGHGFSGYKTREGPFLYALGGGCAPCLSVSPCRDSPQANAGFTRQGGKINYQELPLLQNPRANTFRAAKARNRAGKCLCAKMATPSCEICKRNTHLCAKDDGPVYNPAFECSL